ncbi:IS256 family transposase [Mammaliicoccus sciuri]|uniref:IS256 family transposase n=1 Tax=Mammaliicoccus sciuri TaxID=1296 RepID=UPI0008075CC8|nr:IS256 family transposase [Mammaliicoccus sciuri]MCJ1759638.1 IS256 family transposase [Mammaliicoccus sciuri]MEB6199010.1 IS256 family transposase [Mammaliicoccus sciuri]MEB6257323.1 IS256 family transposase [Mammaliicoccus sciuri]MEB6263993.1 IS256 family transposase [Mammaliicoccus sciuri]MEB6696440.1 IS256 family transposase [Mammaliicoccus sciuri]
MARKKRDPKSVELANKIIAEYSPESVEDMENALKDVFGPMFEAMLQGEMNNHLGYSSNDKSDKTTENRRNGYGNKILNTTKGNIEINVPRDRDASFEPQLIKKRQRDVSEIEDKVISMYAKGMSQRDISSTIEDIYGFSVSHEMISDITDAVIPEMEEWQTRPLEKCYTFIFVDCLYTKIRTDYEIKEYAVYTILGYTIDGKKQILGLWLNETESKHKWMQIFDEIKARGVEDIFFLSMDGVSGLESGVKAIFPKTIVQRCIVHLVRNSIKYVPSKDYKAFTSLLRKVYGATSLKACHTAFEAFKQQWSQYPGAVEVWKRNFTHVEQLFDYGSNIRKIMYTTNAVESIHSSYRKVTKKGAFPNENALLKLLFIRTKELQKKWSTGYIPNWSMVMNQLLLHDQIKDRVIKYP